MKKNIKFRVISKIIICLVLLFLISSSCGKKTERIKVDILPPMAKDTFYLAITLDELEKQRGILQHNQFFGYYENYVCEWGNGIIYYHFIDDLLSVISFEFNDLFLDEVERYRSETISHYFMNFEKYVSTVICMSYYEWKRKEYFVRSFFSIPCDRNPKGRIDKGEFAINVSVMPSDTSFSVYQKVED